MRAHLSSFLFATAVTVVASPAFAQDAAPAAPAVPAAPEAAAATEPVVETGAEIVASDEDAALAGPIDRAPEFTLLTNNGPGFHGGADVAYLFSIADGDDTAMAQMRVGAQYVNAAGIGGYASIAGTAGTNGFFAGDAAFGNLELGGLYRLAALIPGLDLGARLGLILPTSRIDESADADNAGIFAHAAATATARPTDFFTAMPELTAIRVGASPSYRSGILFAQADLGVDIAVDEPAGGDAPLLGHANVGVGAGLASFAATAEIQNVINIDADEGEERFSHVAGVSAQYRAAKITGFLSLTSPIDDGARGNVLTVTAGFRSGI